MSKGARRAAQEQLDAEFSQLAPPCAKLLTDGSAELVRPKVRTAQAEAGDA